MEDIKVAKILKRCEEVIDIQVLTLKWVNNFLKEHPHIVEIPDELSKSITDAQIDLFDLKILLENHLKSLVENKENE